MERRKQSAEGEAGGGSERKMKRLNRRREKQTKEFTEGKGK